MRALCFMAGRDRLGEGLRCGEGGGGDKHQLKCTGRGPEEWQAASPSRWTRGGTQRRITARYIIPPVTGPCHLAATDPAPAEGTPSPPNVSFNMQTRRHCLGPRFPMPLRMGDAALRQAGSDGAPFDSALRFPSFPELGVRPQLFPSRVSSPFMPRRGEAREGREGKERPAHQTSPLKHKL
ncbi:hypothetical protein AAFF_G00213290 [Aldrovandia affinis]|uniref:Uncharacterized protein n=1 Tax=Aldrovandia affinis TaxID=143900 RepID=A0AAD7RH02_9TELE|nr:hypothetical protein AAFF_G00213290 [Aldrovandia affinis]